MFALFRQEIPLLLTLLDHLLAPNARRRVLLQELEVAGSAVAVSKSLPPSLALCWLYVCVVLAMLSLLSSTIIVFWGSKVFEKENVRGESDASHISDVFSHFRGCVKQQ
jgi:hypothetical protein